MWVSASSARKATLFIESTAFTSTNLKREEPPHPYFRKLFCVVFSLFMPNVLWAQKYVNPLANI